MKDRVRLCSKSFAHHHVVAVNSSASQCHGTKLSRNMTSMMTSLHKLFCRNFRMRLSRHCMHCFVTIISILNDCLLSVSPDFAERDTELID